MALIAETVPLPEAATREAERGRYLAQTTCTQCHATNLVALIRLLRYCAGVAAERINYESECSINQGALLPVTARLSRKFYERFGDEIAGEFVDWFNAVDATYQQQLRELNDLNWERFKATIDSRFATFEARFATFDARFDTFDARFAASESRFTEKLSETKSDLMKWMFIYWSGTVITLGGLTLALVRK